MKNYKKIYTCLSGSKAYGLDHPDSDTDIRGVIVYPEKDYFAITRPQETIERIGATKDLVYHELRKFFVLATQNNPNILEMLYVDSNHIISTDVAFLDVLKNKDIFLSKEIYHRYKGYAKAQMSRMQNKYDRDGELNIKHARHVVRLLISGIHGLRGKPLVNVADYRDEILSINHLNDVNLLVEKYSIELEKANKETKLPTKPDTSRISELLYYTYHRFWKYS